MRKVLQILIVIEILTVLVGIPMDMYLQRYLPSEIQDYIASAEMADITYLQTFAVSIGVVVFFLYIVSWIGLWKRWRPARLIYTICWICFLPLYLFVEPVIYYTPAGAIFTEAGTLSAGMIFGIIYFSDLKRSFEKKAIET